MYSQNGPERNFVRLPMMIKGCVALAVCLFILTSGCSTLNGVLNKTKTDGSSKGQQATELEPESQASQLQSRERDQIVQLQAREQDQIAQLQACEDRIAQFQSQEEKLEKQVRAQNAKLATEKVARESLIRRLEVVQDAREDAIREVVRIRARIQGMASQAGASAMFAEARVILDRMDEEAFNRQALEDLELARSYIARGKGALDTGNPGGAAYLFDLIPGLYESMRKAEPRVVKIDVRIAILRKFPMPSSSKAGSLYWGEVATGIEKSKDWMKVKTSSGKTGWIMKNQVQ